MILDYFTLHCIVCDFRLNQWHCCKEIYIIIYIWQVVHVEQQQLLIRQKRHIVHDKQIELPIREVEDKSLYQRFSSKSSLGRPTKDFITQTSGINDMGFNDPFFKDQWYLVGQQLI